MYNNTLMRGKGLDIHNGVGSQIWNRKTGCIQGIR